MLTELNILRANSKTVGDVQTSLTQDLELKNSELGVLSSDISTKDNELEKLRTELGKVKKELTAKTNAVLDAEHKVSLLGIGHEQSVSDLKKMEIDKDSLTNELAACNKLIVEQGVIIAELKGLQNVTERSSSSLNGQLASLQAQFDALSKRNKELLENISQRDVEIERLTHNSSESSSRQNSLNLQVQSLKEQLALEKSNGDDLVEQLKTAKDRIHELEDEIMDVKEEMKRKSEQNSKLLMNIENLEELKTKLRHEISEVEAECFTKNAELAEQRESNLVNVKEMADLRRQLNQVSTSETSRETKPPDLDMKELSDLRLRLEVNEKELADMHVSYDKQTNELQEAKAEIKRLNENLGSKLQEYITVSEQGAENSARLQKLGELLRVKEKEVKEREEDIDEIKRMLEGSIKECALAKADVESKKRRISELERLLAQKDSTLESSSMPSIAEPVQNTVISPVVKSTLPASSTTTAFNTPRTAQMRSKMYTTTEEIEATHKRLSKKEARVSSIKPTLTNLFDLGSIGSVELALYTASAILIQSHARGMFARTRTRKRLRNIPHVVNLQIDYAESLPKNNDMFGSKPDVYVLVNTYRKVLTDHFALSFFQSALLL